MSSQASQSLIRRFFDAYNRNDLKVMGEIASPEYTCHVGGLPEPIVGLQANLAADASVRAAFSAIRWTIDDIFGDGDKVVARRTWSMTHTGPFEGQSASGRTLTGTGIDIFYVRDGKLVEQWSESDNLSFMQQLGALPAAEREPGL